MSIKLGIIGASEGNGHPYSWSAIFNGYDKERMAECGYPVIPKYLAQQDWPSSQIIDAKVVSIWTQDIKLSEHIAHSTHIDTVVSNLSDLKQKADAILLARDDSENHLNFASPFILSGMPIYIDKPVALSKRNLIELYNLQQYPGQIFTCSALRYSKDLMLTYEDRQKLGKIISISASTPNSWEKYGIHIIEPVLNMISKNDRVINHKKTVVEQGEVTLSTNWESGLCVKLCSLGDKNSEINIDIIGTHSEKKLIFHNPFNAFKSALEDYIGGIVNKECRSPFDFNLRAVSLIEKGLE